MLEEQRRKPRFDIPYTKTDLDGQEMSSKYRLNEDKTDETSSPSSSPQHSVAIKENG